MTLRVVGAGMGRTGTHSLKIALEKLLGGPCYHMREVFEHPEHVRFWREAAEGRMPDWDRVFDGYVAAVDWPAAAFWPELMDVYPDALILLSLRDPENWWESASNTIFPGSREMKDSDDATSRLWYEMVEAMMNSRFTPLLDNKAAAIAAFNANNQRVRDVVPASRLLEWRAGDSWEPICAALDLPVPDEPFPITNTREEWAARREAARQEAQRS